MSGKSSKELPMNNTPTSLKYAKTHEWVRQESDGTVTIGITDHAQQLLGDMVFVELPTADIEVIAGKEVAVVESVKAASDVYTPLSGKIIAVNNDLQAEPELINTAPYEAGWIYKLQPSNTAELRALLSAEQYQHQTAE
jgi:glycine cleavage system H protein